MESYEVCIFGELVLPMGQSDAWRVLRIDGRVFTDWPEAFRWKSDEAEVTVGRWLDDAAIFGGGNERFFDVDRHDERDGSVRWTLRARVGDTEYETHRRTIVTLFRLAGAVGGHGRLFLMSDPETEFAFGYRVTVDPSFSALTSLDPLDHESVREAAALVS